MFLYVAFIRQKLHQEALSFILHMFLLLGFRVRAISHMKDLINSIMNEEY